ncbi:hypothetical protein V1517DRAFT_190205 [Lipomyces orientalis]|uniref:Uncharacterized protein n=1 Tax=Lipomyces orientalis TaxID=1233043 RepID=A0ACC3TX77_9ASCO
MGSGDRGSSRYTGLYQGGVWKCDCPWNPPAAYREVKKEGRNKGRFFYGCATGKCKFFLWEDDARPREGYARPTQAQVQQPALVNLSPVEATHATRDPAQPQRRMNIFPVATVRAASTAGSSVGSEKTANDDDETVGGRVESHKLGFDTACNEWAHAKAQSEARLSQLESENIRLLSRRGEVIEKIGRLRDKIARDEEELLSLKARRRDLEFQVHSRT